MATITSAGAVPDSPTTIRDNIVANATALSPGLTANLPGSLIEDMASTATGAAVIQDQAYVDLVNSISATTANPFILYALGQMYGIQQGVGSNTSVYVVFSGTPGFVINVGFIVSDGINQYTVQDGGVISASGQSSQLFCLAVNSGSFAVPAGTVTQIITSVPSGVTLSVTNPQAGIPGTTGQTLAQYQAQVIQAGQATVQGAPSLIKTKLELVSGVQPYLVDIRNVGVGQWEVICGGGDPYQIANAIYQSVPDISMLTGSVLAVTSITNANPGVVTVDLNHGYSTGQVVTIAGVNPSTFNGTYTITVLSEKSFSIGVDTTTFGTYVSGGVVTPNLRNITVSLNNYPDTYSITFVNPPVQTVDITVTWNTISTNLVSPTAVAQLAQPAIADYINTIPVGQPINTYYLEDSFQNAVSSILNPQLISKLLITVAINGIVTSPATNSLLIYGDPESYLSTNASLITITQG